jgi:hypothetical protein
MTGQTACLQGKRVANRRRALIALGVAISLTAFGDQARAADPGTGLSEAESRAVTAEANITSAQAKVDVARNRLSATSRRAVPAARAVRRTRAQARDLRSTLTDRQSQARARISELEAAHTQEVEDHDQEVINGIGTGLAALIGAGIALAWGWFRASTVVAALSRTDLGRALALCLGGGLLLVIVGAALGEAKGPPGAMGALLFGLGFVLPIALLLARHSAEVQRGRANPALKRDRLPSWVPRGVAALLLLLALGGLGSSLFAERPDAFLASAQLRADSTTLESGPDARRLDEATAEAIAAQKRAAEPLSELRAARAGLRRVGGELHGAKSRLVSAEADQRRFAQRLAVLVAREEQEAAKAAAQAERESIGQIEEEEEEVSSGCDSNYTGCVPVYPPDVDCDEVGETVTVVGSDPHGLDADGDLIGCE